MRLSSICWRDKYYNITSKQNLFNNKKFKKEEWKLRGMRLFEEMLETIKNRYAGKNWKKIMEEERDIEDQIY